MIVDARYNECRIVAQSRQLCSHADASKCEASHASRCVVVKDGIVTVSENRRSHRGGSFEHLSAESLILTHAAG